MVNLKKVMSCTLAVAMVMGAGAVMAGCSKDKNSGSAVEIAEDDLWYNTKKLVLDAGYDQAEFAMVQSGTPIIAGDKIVVNYLCERNYNIKDAMKPDFDYNSLILNEIAVFDKEGKLENKTDISELLNKDKSKVAQVNSVARSGDTIVVYYTISDAMEQKSKTYSAAFDLEKGELGKPTELDVDSGAYIQTVKSVGKYTVLVSVNYTESSSELKLYIQDNGELVSTANVSGDLKEDGIYSCDRFSLDGDNTLLFSCNGEGYPFRCKVDISSGKATKLEEDTSSNRVGSSFTSADGEAYYFDNEGMKKVNDGGDDELLCGIGDCNVNVNHVANSEIIDIQDGAFYLNYIDYGLSGLNSQNTLYILEKADKNPNAGKKVIRAQSLGSYIANDEAEGIRTFNETNSEYFVKLEMADDSELEAVYSGSGDKDSYTQENERNKAVANMTNELAVDLMGGTGPDIILNASGVNELQNEEYLEDLNKYITGEKGVNKDDFYVNVIDASQVDGKLYNLPLSYALEGIATSTENVKGDKEGFTFEEYKKFLDEVCNGQDPISEYRDRVEYFSDLAAPMIDLWIKDGKANFDDDAFRALAEFVKDNVSETMTSNDEDYYVNTDEMGNIVTNYEVPEATRLYLYNIEMYFTSIGDKKELGLYGLPSVDGRGPSIDAVSSVAISSKSEVKDGCWDFIKTLMSEDIQKQGECNVINKNAELDVLDKAYDDYASLYETYLEMGIPEAQITSLGVSKPNEGAKETYLKILEKASVSSTTDPAVMNVIHEELQGYFAGQTDIDTVIKNINDRAQTIIDERS